MAPNPSLLPDHTYVSTEVFQERMPIQTRRIPLSAPPGKNMSSAQSLVDLSALQELKALTPSQLGSPETEPPYSMGSNLTQKIQKRSHLASCLSWPKLWMPFKNTSGIQKTAGAASLTLKQSTHSKHGTSSFSMLLIEDKVAWQTNGTQGAYYLNEKPMVFLFKNQMIQPKKEEKPIPHRQGRVFFSQVMTTLSFSLGRAVGVHGFPTLFAARLEVFWLETSFQLGHILWS